MAKADRPTISGSIFPATKEGFKEFLLEANRVEADGYAFLTLVRLDTGIAAIYRRGASVSQRPDLGSFFDDV